ncbi:hypothetical protein KAX97_05255 [candidate division WOR-3 bacterium]|nr:hypothetical protein [candidate division WOR-3 bacterium]
MNNLSILIQYGLKRFNKHMYIILLNNNYKGDSWLTCDITFLRNKLNEEIKEYFEAKNDTERMIELLDISNICLFLYIRCMLTSGENLFNEYLKEIRKR